MESMMGVQGVPFRLKSRIRTGKFFGDDGWSNFLRC